MTQCRYLIEVTSVGNKAKFGTIAESGEYRAALSGSDLSQVAATDAVNFFSAEADQLSSDM